MRVRSYPCPGCGKTVRSVTTNHEREVRRLENQGMTFTPELRFALADGQCAECCNKAAATTAQAETRSHSTPHTKAERVRILRWRIWLRQASNQARTLAASASSLARQLDDLREQLGGYLPLAPRGESSRSSGEGTGPTTRGSRSRYDLQMTLNPQKAFLDALRPLLRLYPIDRPLPASAAKSHSQHPRPRQRGKGLRARSKISR